MHTIAFLLLTACSAPSPDNWPQFLGPSGDATSPQASLPLHWSESQNIRWKTPIHDRGHSSPVVWDKQIWLTTAAEDGRKLFAMCIDRDTGRIVYDLKVFNVEKPEHINDLNSYASPTPAIEQGRVYVNFGAYGTACLDTATGKTLWSRRDLYCKHAMGPGASPLLYKDLLIINYDGTDVQYVVALDKRTGKTVWKTARSTDFTKIIPDQRKAYSTPIVIDAGGLQLISCGAQATTAYEPSTGRELWKLRSPGYSNVPRPVYGLGLLFVATGFDRPELWALRPGGRGDLDSGHVAWKCKAKNLPLKPSFVLVGERLYLVSDTGFATCLDARTGETVWQQRIHGRFSASPLSVPGRVYFFDQDGKTTVIAPEGQLKIITVNTLDEGCMASPAVTGKALILRTSGHLYRIEE